MPESAVAPLDRLDFTLPDFTRLAWVSDHAKATWQPRLARITSAWMEIEWRAVLAGARRCALTMVSPEAFMEQGAVWAGEGLNALPVEMAGVSGQPYSATGVPFRPGEPFVFRFVIGRPADVVVFKAAWDAAEQEQIGDLLGYPGCCREFFRRTWVDDGLVDTTWPMAVGTVAPVNGETTLEVSGPPQSNILWRWMGARAVPHLPCRFDCPATVEFADKLIGVGRECGFEEEMDWLLQILSWPAEWSALHGIAEIKTPVVKVSTRTDSTARKYTVRRQGEALPDEALQGLNFPFDVPVKLRLTATRGFRKGLEHMVGVDGPRPSWYVGDNGFASIAAMDNAHRPVVEGAIAALAGASGDVVDLGCGNGVLLEKIAAAVPGVVPYGIDIEPVRIEHARLLQSKRATNFVAGDVFGDDQLWPDGRRYALAILMPGRLVEAGPERGSALLHRLRTHCDCVLLYAYGDWLDRFGGLTALAREAGLDVDAASSETVGIARFDEL